MMNGEQGRTTTPGDPNAREPLADFIDSPRAENRTYIDFVEHLHDGCEQRGLLTPDAETRPYDRILFDALDVANATIAERDARLAAIAEICEQTALSSNPGDYVAASVAIEALAKGETP